MKKLISFEGVVGLSLCIIPVEQHSHPDKAYELNMKLLNAYIVWKRWQNFYNVVCFKHYL